MARAETLREGARDAADGKPVDGGADIARSRRRMLERQHIERREVLAVHERPAHRLAPHHADCMALERVTGEAAEDAAVAL